MDATFPLKAGRRAFLSCILWASLLWRKLDPASAQSAVVRRLDPSAREILEAVVDAIVPRDRDPGALDAGVPARILAHLSAHPEALKLYQAGLGLVDRLAQQSGAPSFRGLDEPERERILSSLSNAPVNRRTRAIRPVHPVPPPPAPARIASPSLEDRPRISATMRPGMHGGQTVRRVAGPQGGSRRPPRASVRV